ncbi:substrate-binding domain-containing protein [Maridesulfovibrio ferrireducens]|uniref:substrate-binding domain-containing protein n=1 Tax=Maridesulfovibrio ferrireducens TaxID=246191 RepID=UPI001A25094B|nr:substrate-binding domain-containing protein [Maridesulfovibrio ferrireducens]MBI9111128.1 substrate-binding domain-containing protein [Maridesulfovibrio ferrireducens]
MTKEIRVFAAGSLRKVLPAMAGRSGFSINSVFGPSGVLRERIAQGERPALYLSANLKHCKILADMDLCSEPIVFTENSLCLFGRPSALQRGDALQNMLSSENRVGTSTPVDDPGGDYAFSVFDRAEVIQPGSREVLRNKALTLVGGKNSPKSAGPHSPVYGLFAEDKVDLFLGYRTTAMDIARRMDNIEIMDLPDSLSVKAQYFAVVIEKNNDGVELLKGLQASAAQNALEEFGFKRP